MSNVERSAELATGWIEAWIRMDMDWLRRHLAPDFVHTSPFGRLEGREHYLATVEPMARRKAVPGRKEMRPTYGRRRSPAVPVMRSF